MNEHAEPPSDPAPLTTRQRLNRIRRVTGSLIVAGLLGLVFGSRSESFAIFLLSALALGSGLLIRTLLGRCSRCHRRLSRVLSFEGWPWMVSRHIRFCPFCAASIDEPRTELRSL
jgi:hypothetical protein